MRRLQLFVMFSLNFNLRLSFTFNLQLSSFCLAASSWRSRWSKSSEWRWPAFCSAATTTSTPQSDLMAFVSDGVRSMALVDVGDVTWRASTLTPRSDRPVSDPKPRFSFNNSYHSLFFGLGGSFIFAPPPPHTHIVPFTCLSFLTPRSVVAFSVTITENDSSRATCMGIVTQSTAGLVWIVYRVYRSLPSFIVCR